MTFSPYTQNTSIGIAGGAGTLQVSSGILSLLSQRWLGIGRSDGTGQINVGTLTLPVTSFGSVTIQNASGGINFNSTVDGTTSGGQNLSINSGTGTTTFNGMVGNTTSLASLSVIADNVAINADLIGSGKQLSFSNFTRFRTMAIGTGATGSTAFSEAMLNHIVGWAGITFNSNDGNIDATAHTYTSDLLLAGTLGSITVDGALSMGAHNLTFGVRTAVPIIFNVNISGSGTLTIENYGSSGTEIDIGSLTSNTTLTDASLGKIQPGWVAINFLGYVATNYKSSGGYQFSSPTTFSVLSGGSSISIQSPLTAASGSNGSFSFNGGGNASVTANINGNIDTSLSNSGTGTVNFSQLAAVNVAGNITTKNSNITFAASAPAITLTGSSILNAGTGTIATNGTLNASSYNLTLTSDVISLGGNLSGTGALTLSPSTANTVLHINDGTNTGWFLNATELGYIGNGAFSSVTYGSNSGTGAINIGAETLHANRHC